MANEQTQFVFGSHRLDPDATIAALLEKIPAALALLIQLGFTPLADPILRERLAPTVTIRQAAETLPINLDRLLTDLEHLAESGGASS